MDIKVLLAKPLEKLLGPLSKEIGEDIVALYRIPKNLAKQFYEKLTKKNVTAEKIATAMVKSTTVTTKILRVCDQVRTHADEDIQQLFAEIMASEIEQEGSYSLETIHRLSLMTRQDLEYFYNEIAPFCFLPHGVAKLYDEVNGEDVDMKLRNLNVIHFDLAPAPLNDEKEQLERQDDWETSFYNGQNISIKSKHVSICASKMCNLNQFGIDLCKLGAAENKIRKWTQEDKAEILRGLKVCGVKEEEVKFNCT